MLTTRSEKIYLFFQYVWLRFVLRLISSFIICVFYKQKKAYMTAATCYVCLERPVVTDWTRRGDWTCNPSMTSVKLYTFLFHFFVSVIVLKSWQKKQLTTSSNVMWIRPLSDTRTHVPHCLPPIMRELTTFVHQLNIWQVGETRRIFRMWRTKILILADFPAIAFVVVYWHW